jgi:hypothetical protein
LGQEGTAAWGDERLAETSSVVLVRLGGVLAGSSLGKGGQFVHVFAGCLMRGHSIWTHARFDVSFSVCADVASDLETLIFDREMQVE